MEKKIKMPSRQKRRSISTLERARIDRARFVRETLAYVQEQLNSLTATLTSENGAGYDLHIKEPNAPNGRLVVHITPHINPRIRWSVIVPPYKWQDRGDEA